MACRFDELWASVRHCRKHGLDDIAEDFERVLISLTAIRAIVTEWNFGPTGDRDALVAIHGIIGDDIQEAA